MKSFRLPAVAVLSLLACGASLPASARAPITAVTAAAVPAHYAGACPAALEFVGSFKVSKAPVTVEYLWERSNGSRTQVRRIQARSGTQKITDEWAVGGAPGTLKVWEKLVILSPSTISSAMATASIDCR